MGKALNDPRIRPDARLAYNSTIIEMIVRLRLVWFLGDFNWIIIIDFEGIGNAISGQMQFCAYCYYVMLFMVKVPSKFPSML